MRRTAHQSVKRHGKAQQIASWQPNRREHIRSEGAQREPMGPLNVKARQSTPEHTQWHGTPQFESVERMYTKEIGSSAVQPQSRARYVPADCWLQRVKHVWALSRWADGCLLASAAEERNGGALEEKHRTAR